MLLNSNMSLINGIHFNDYTLIRLNVGRIIHISIVLHYNQITKINQAWSSMIHSCDILVKLQLLLLVLNIIQREA